MTGNDDRAAALRARWERRAGRTLTAAAYVVFGAVSVVLGAALGLLALTQDAAAGVTAILAGVAWVGVADIIDEIRDDASG